MINIKNINVELFLSSIFTFLLIVVAIKDAEPIWSHFHFLGDLWSFEIDRTWGSQMTLTQSLIFLGFVVLTLFIVIMRVRQIIANR